METVDSVKHFSKEILELTQASEAIIQQKTNCGNKHS